MPDLSALTDRELYRLAFDISEELVERETERICQYGIGGAGIPAPTVTESGNWWIVTDTDGTPAGKFSTENGAKCRSESLVGRYEIARPTPKKVDTSFPGYSVKVA